MGRRAGFGLILVLWIIVILSALCLSLTVATRRESRAMHRYRAQIVGRYSAESAVTLAVATLELRLASLNDDLQRRAYLNDLGHALGGAAQLDLGDGKAAVTLVDVGSRLDVNMAEQNALARLFSYFTTPTEAERNARAINDFIGGDIIGFNDDPTALIARPVTSLDELVRIPGISQDLLDRAAPYLTVDGDGTINRITASDTVRSAAAGDLRDEPSRILVIARGRANDQAAAYEIQAVYALNERQLTLVKWRERQR